AGGGDLQALAGQVEAERVVREERRNRLTELEERVYPLVGLDEVDAPDLETALDNAAAFGELQLAARKRLAEAEEEQARQRVERDRARDGIFPIKAKQTELLRERASLESRAGRVPSHLDDLRNTVAEASGLRPDELPFVAELIDVAPEEARDRK